MVGQYGLTSHVTYYWIILLSGKEPNLVDGQADPFSGRIIRMEIYIEVVDLYITNGKERQFDG